MKLTIHEADDQRAQTDTSLRTESSGRLPVAAYAYTPDPTKPSTWRLPLWESAESAAPSLPALGRVAAALSPGGLSGVRTDVPREAIAEVKATVREAYRECGVAYEEMPKWVKETGDMTRLLAASVQPLEEGALDTAKGEAVVTVIRPGFNESKSRFYPAEMLRRDHGIFRGVKMFADHATRREDSERPEGSVNQWVATVKEVWAEADGTIKGRVAIIDSAFRQKLTALAEHGLLSDMGTSIRAIGSGVKSTVQGVKTNLIERLKVGRSVDFVTMAGAGGRVEMLEGDESATHDVDLIDEHRLRELRPDLIEIIEASCREANPTHGGASDMDELTEATARAEKAEHDLQESAAKVAAVEAERDTLKAAVEETQRVQARESAQREIAEALSKADLPEPVKALVAKRFVAAENSEGISEAIAEQVALIAELQEAGVVKGMGEGQEKTKTDEGRTELVAAFAESFRRKGYSEEDALRRAEASAGR